MEGRASLETTKPDCIFIQYQQSKNSPSRLAKSFNPQLQQLPSTKEKTLRRDLPTEENHGQYPFGGPSTARDHPELVPRNQWQVSASA
jgi:hypothetical protein